MTVIARRAGTALRGATVALASGVIALAGSGVATADATDDYPIPNRILRTSCTPEQIMAAARDVEPVFYERYMIDYINKSPETHQAVTDICAKYPPNDQGVWDW